MTKNGLIALAAAAALLAASAQAATLTNRSAEDLVVQISGDGGEPATQDVVLRPDETVTGVCENGCVMVLENGAQRSFDGDEDIYVDESGFVTAE